MFEISSQGTCSNLEVDIFDLCLFNFTNSASYDVSINEQQQFFNISYNYDFNCQDSMADELYSNKECTYSWTKNTAYLVALLEIPPPIPSGSMLHETYTNDCKSVMSYLYLTNGTTVYNLENPDHSDTYMCIDQKAYVYTCDGMHPCQQIALAPTKCHRNASPYQISCVK
eukprot:gene17960-21433_t